MGTTEITNTELSLLRKINAQARPGYPGSIPVVGMETPEQSSLAQKGLIAHWNSTFGAIPALGCWYITTAGEQVVAEAMERGAA